ncbi:MAG: hypothetical protein WBO04_03250 [Steroidobacteraceae bacterium]
MKNALSIAFLAVVLALGLWALLNPDGIIAFRRRLGWPENFWSGGYFYATAGRARISGAIMVIVSLAALFLALAKSR